MSNFTPNGNLSLKPHQGRSFKRARRIEIVARLEAKFVTDQDIADTLGLTVAAIQAIKKSPEYRARVVALANNELSVYDQARLGSDEGLKDKLNELVPRAMLGLEKILGDPTHPHFAKVAVDLLDRNKATSKISRTEHSIELPKATQDQNDRAKELMGLLEPDKLLADPSYDPNKTSYPESGNVDSFTPPNPRAQLPEFVPVPDKSTEEDILNNTVTKSELDKAIEDNPDVNDLIM